MDVRGPLSQKMARSMSEEEQAEYKKIRDNKEKDKFPLAWAERKLKEMKRGEDKTGVTSFKEELSRLMNHVCHKCGRMGPILDDNSSEMTCARFEEDDTVWRCGACAPDSLCYLDVKKRLGDRTNNLSKAFICTFVSLRIYINTLINIQTSNVVSSALCKIK